MRYNSIDNNILEFHIAHNEGNYFCTNDQLKEIEDNNQVAINYCSNEGVIENQFNPNGSIKNIAGIFNKEKNGNSDLSKFSNIYTLIKKILNVSQIREIDNYTIAKKSISAIELMESAATSFVKALEKHDIASKRIIVVCGTGNNGGDGLAISRLLIFIDEY